MLGLLSGKHKTDVRNDIQFCMLSACQLTILSYSEQGETLIITPDKKESICGGWTYNLADSTCTLFSRKVCCGQRDHQRVNVDTISGFTCPSCYSLTGSCPCNSTQLNGIYIGGILQNSAGGTIPETNNPTVST